MRARASLAVLMLVAAPGAAAGQGLAERISRTQDGVVRFSFPVREGVEICDQGIRLQDRRMTWHSAAERSMETGCKPGPAEVELTLRDGRVRNVEVVGGWREPTTGATDLGPMPAREAADYFLSLARSRADRNAASDAVFPLVLADVEAVWRDLLELARNREVLSGARESALFWAGQEAADAVTEGLAGVALDEDEDQDIRDAAVFALSQRPADEGVPILMEVARTAREIETRRNAMFWLAQSGDDRVIAFFEEILLGRSGGGSMVPRG